MKILPAKLIFIFTASAFLLLSACRSNEIANTSNNANRGNAANNSNKNSMTASDDVEELGKIIKLPFVPEEATWREINENAKRKKIIAVLKFAPADSQNLIVQAEKYSPTKTESIGVENWFPAELVAQSQLSGDETVRATTYAANDFFQNSYSNGRLSRIEQTSYFVLELTSN
jgi:hypothetical protein